MTTTTATFDALPSHVQDDLIEWYNVSEPDDEDKRRLADLYSAGKFHAWHCPTCGERVRSGQPDDWSNFQGVHEPDHSSYPGDPDVFTQETIEKQCDDCRMQGFQGAKGADAEPEY